MKAAKSLQLVIALVLLLLLAGFYLWMGTINSYAGDTSDSHYYLFLADFFTRSADVGPGIESYIAQIAHFPPGYPFALGMFGGGVDSIERAHVINNAFFAVGFIVFFIWLHANGLKPLAAVTLSLALALNSKQLLYSVDILSESQFFLCSALIIVLLENIKSRDRLLLASLMIGLGILSRTIGIAFLLPLLVQLFRFPADWLRKGFIFFLALLPPLGWMITQDLFLKSPYIPRDGYLDYLGAVYADAPVQVLLHTVNSNLLAQIQAWSSYLSGLPSVLHLFVAISLGVSILACWIIRLRRLDSLALYLFAYFGIVMLWPYSWQLHRFMVPVFPFLVAMLVLDCGGLFDAKKDAVRNIVLGVIVISFLPATFALTQRMLTKPDEEYAGYRMTPSWLATESLEEATHILEVMRIRDVAAQTINQHIGEADCVYALQPSAIMIASQKMSFALLLRDFDSVDFDPKRLSVCNYVFMVAGMKLQFDSPDLFPYELMRDQLRPVFISEVQKNDRKVLVAMLAEIIREEENEKTEQTE